VLSSWVQALLPQLLDTFSYQRCSACVGLIWEIPEKCCFLPNSLAPWECTQQSSLVGFSPLPYHLLPSLAFSLLSLQFSITVSCLYSHMPGLSPLTGVQVVVPLMPPHSFPLQHGLQFALPTQIDLCLWILSQSCNQFPGSTLILRAITHLSQ
jgi:hypothetical protein